MEITRFKFERVVLMGILKSKSGVSKELFKNYFIGYIALIIIMSGLFAGTFILYTALKFMPSAIGFWSINDKLLNNYREITQDELKSVNGFLIVINKDNNVEYKKGNVIREFEKIEPSDYIKMLYVYDETQYLKELESLMSIQLDNKIIKSEEGEEYSLFYKFLESENKLIVFGVPYKSINFYNKFYAGGNIKTQLLVLGIVDILILLGLIYIFAKVTARRFIKPIKVLNVGMKDITNGHYGNQIVIKRDNEFKELANGFNIMSNTIKEEKDEIERLQSERNKLILHISHDLKNPLAAVLGYSEILSDKNNNLSDEERNEYLNIISKNSKRANKIIMDLFDLSLLGSTDYKLNTKRIDINEALREIVADYIVELELKEFNYNFEISEDEYLVDLDEVKFTRAISNLIDNSIKYNDKGTTLSVITRKNNNSIEIIISDDGKGINKDIRKRIFDAFIREDEARNSSTGGTGIGLAITKAIIERHKGCIELMDTERGTAYKIML